MSFKKRFLAFTFIAFLLHTKALAQGDSAIHRLAFTPVYNHQFTLLDFKERFLPHAMPGISLDFHHKKGLIFSGGFEFMFRDTIAENGILSSLENDQGFIIDGAGQLVNVFLWQRGFHVSARVSKHFDLGLKKTFLSAGLGLGFIQHKILLYTRDFYLPQLQGDYVKGYDRLSNGIALSQFLRINHRPFAKNYAVFFGINALQGFTENRRTFNFDQRLKEEGLRKDFSLGFSLGITILFDRRRPNDYYFY